jgi:tRNA (Thr-GGU) A37 N-methylase
MDVVELVLHPIGIVRNDRTDAVDGWDRVDTCIQLDPSMLEEQATVGLGGFSHVEVLFVLDRVGEDEVVRGSRHPWENPAWPRVGVLAQRNRARPNRLGSTVCELMSVVSEQIWVRGLDALDGTPVLDVKPYYAEFAPRGDVRQPPWVAESMGDYWNEAHDSGRLDPAVAAAWRAEVDRSPADHGTVEMIVRRPAEAEREVLDEGRLDIEVGLVGDNWLQRGSPNGGPANPDSQLNIMNSRCAGLVAGGRERIAEAGDQLYVDLDLSPGNLPPGTRLALGTAVVEITPKPHNGCAKFTRRFGLAAHRWINSIDGRAANLRGVCAKVIEPGVVKSGDEVRKVGVA